MQISDEDFGRLQKGIRATRDLVYKLESSQRPRGRTGPRGPRGQIEGQERTPIQEMILDVEDTVETLDRISYCL